MDSLRQVLVALSVVYLGLMAGVFWIYGNAIMPGLGNTDDKTFVAAFQSIDSRIINPCFLHVHFGALATPGLASALTWPTPASIWALLAFVLYLAAFVITGAINVPANDRIKAAGDPGHEAREIRDAFDESRWLRWNRIRVSATLFALMSATWALLEL